MEVLKMTTVSSLKAVIENRQTDIHTHSIEDTVSNLDNTKEIAYRPLCETTEYI